MGAFKKTFIKIYPNDLVAVALTPLPAGAALQMEESSVTLLEDIPQGHKFAINRRAATPSTSGAVRTAKK